MLLYILIASVVLVLVGLFSHHIEISVGDKDFPRRDKFDNPTKKVSLTGKNDAIEKLKKNEFRAAALRYEVKEHERFL